MLKDKKIALVYDWIDKWGGVERALIVLHELFPKADFYTSHYLPELAPWAKKMKITTSFWQKWPVFIRKNRLLSFPVYPYIFETFDFSQYDLVISITSAFAKAIITKPTTIHINYLLTPPRYLWFDENNYFPFPVNKLIEPYLNQIRNWDKVAAQRPDKIITISEWVKKRCQKYYGRDSTVIYPPFDEVYWRSTEEKKLSKTIEERDYYLVVSRLEPYKKVDLVIKTFNQLPKKRLIIVGQGSQIESLRKKCGKNIFFTGLIEDEELVGYYLGAKALIMMQEEDFGYTALEAQFFGCPVIAFNQGGVRETVIEYKTGLLFDQQSCQSLRSALETFDSISYNLKTTCQSLGKKQVKKFTKDKFKEKLVELINS